MRAPDPNKQKGEVLIYTGPMKSAKTKTAISHMKAMSQHANTKVVAFTVDVNERDGPDKIKSEDGDEMPAYTIKKDNPEKILEYVAYEDKKKHVDVIGFDEANFYEANLIPVIKHLKSENRVILLVGADKNFRGEPFGIMPRLQELTYPHLISHFHSYCKLQIKDEKEGQRQCGNLAQYTVRLRLDSKHKQNFYDKNGNLITGFGLAPYFDPLILPEEKNPTKRKNQVAYTVACEDCFQTPLYKSETIQAHKELCSGTHRDKIKIPRLDEIINMLVKEDKIKLVGTGIYAPVPYYYDMDIGLAIPRKYKEINLEITNLDNINIINYQ